MKLKYSLLKKEDVDSTVKCIVKIFLYEEPMTKILDITESEFGFFAKLVCKEAAIKRLSYVCKVKGKVIGFCLNDDLISEPPKDLNKVTYKMNPILKILEMLDTAYLKGKKTKKNYFFHLFMIGSLPRYRKIGIAKELTKRSINLANKKNFKRIIVEATNMKSQKLLRNYFKFRIIQKADYKTFKFNKKTPFKNIGEKYCKLMELKLS